MVCVNTFPVRFGFAFIAFILTSGFIRLGIERGKPYGWLLGAALVALLVIGFYAQREIRRVSGR
jgi:hypothetical protein